MILTNKYLGCDYSISISFKKFLGSFFVLYRKTVKFALKYGLHVFKLIKQTKSNVKH